MMKYIILNSIFFIFLHAVLPAQNLDNLALEPGFKISIFAENLSSPVKLLKAETALSSLESEQDK